MTDTIKLTVGGEYETTADTDPGILVVKTGDPWTLEVNDVEVAHSDDEEPVEPPVEPVEPPAGKTYWVATSGNNANNGSSEHPWKTIDYAVASGRGLKPGDTVAVRAGTYNTTGIGIQASGSAGGGYITLKSEEKRKAKVVSSGESGIFVVSKHHVRVEGFDVKASKTGINFSKCHHVEIIDNYSHDNNAQGIYIRESEFILIEGNETFSNNDNNQANNSISVHFMQNASGDTTTEGYRCIVRGNNCHENGLNTTSTDSGGIILDSNNTENFTAKPYAFPRLVENNICWLNGGPGIVILEALNTTVRCNTAWRNGRKPGAGGFTGNLVNRSDNVTWVNNIAVADHAYNPNSPAISVPVLAKRSPQVYENVEWYNNLTWNGNAGQASLFTNVDGNDVNLPTAADGNKLGVNPKLVSPPADCHPAAGSPCIDAGTSSHDGAPKTDHTGAARVPPVDIGAVEYVPS